MLPRSIILAAVTATVLVIAASWRPTTAAWQDLRATIDGSVVDAALAPVGGVVVTLERDGRAVQHATTDTDGLFRFAGVTAGDYRVRVERPGLPAIVRDVRVSAAGGVIHVPLVLSRAEPEKAAEPRVPGDVATGLPGAFPRARRGSAEAMPAVAPPDSSSVGRGGGAAAPAAEPRPAGERTYSVHPGIASAVPYSDWPIRDRYTRVRPSRFQATSEEPLSTFGADVDTASYTNVRRFLSMGSLPPADAVRVEEFVNYFRFTYASPTTKHPIALTTEVGECPWAPTHRLVLIGARARAASPRAVAGRNLVLLLDVSGSMAPPDRLPLIKAALLMFVETLAPHDRLAIVTYAGSSRIALPSTPVRQRSAIEHAIDRLQAGGSTNGGEGIITAYRTAREAFVTGGVNRVILATDGDFNVGIVNRRDLVRLIERERGAGIFLSVFGVGTGNLNDAMMEMLADRGNGHYAYLDSLQEARRVLVRERDAALTVVAKDVKFQVEFNPAEVAGWKLIGYENRQLAAEDFNDDRKDAGEMGAGHTVTVLYEIIPVGASSDDRDRPAVDPLRYQDAPRPTPQPSTRQPALRPGELLTVKARYQEPDGTMSQLITVPVRAGGRVQHLPLAASVAEFGLLLRDDSRDRRRWDGLAERVRRLSSTGPLAADLDQFRELVAIARGLAR
jgi:Ca-activated chloride channel family protein